MTPSERLPKVHSQSAKPQTRGESNAMHMITIAPTRPGQFSVHAGDRLLVRSSRTPFLDGARKLLATGLAEPDDIVVMVYAANPSTECLRAKAGVAAVRAPRAAASVAGEPTRNRSKCLEALERKSVMNGGTPPMDVINDTEFITDLARYGEGVLTEAQVKRKYRGFDDDVWEKLGSDDALVEAIEAERTRRALSGPESARKRNCCTRKHPT
jgi:hypothetical protein